ncbi:MAG: septum formation family protein [Chloroflexi bacterium]|nr:septum formation family protein [Chloroflexota bacterium]
MRPLSAALLVLLIVAAGAVGVAVWVTSNSPDASDPPSGDASSRLSSEPSHAPSPTPRPEYDFPTVDSIGACFDPILQRGTGSLLAMRIWDCDEPHLAELLGIDEIDEPASARWPGSSAIDRDAEAICRDIFLEYVGISFEESSVSMTFTPPNEESWATGDRLVWCFADTTRASPFTSSVRNLGE